MPLVLGTSVGIFTAGTYFLILELCSGFLVATMNTVPNVVGGSADGPGSAWGRG